MTTRSAGIVLMRDHQGVREVLLVHPGGPFWAHKNEGAWSIPKGLIGAGEDAEVAARREFFEETGAVAPSGPAVDLGEVTMKSGKKVRAFALHGAFDVAQLRSNLVELEQPSGRRLTFPEVDRAEWVASPRARVLVNASQWPLLERAYALP